MPSNGRDGRQESPAGEGDGRGTDHSGSSVPAGGAACRYPWWCPSTTSGPTGTVTVTSGARVASDNAPTLRKCSADNASAGVSTAAIGTPRAWPCVTRSAIVSGANSSAMAALSSPEAAYRAAMVSNSGPANCAGSPSQALIPRHCRADSRQIRTKPSLHSKMG